jgi:hypothetical protein
MHSGHYVCAMNLNVLDKNNNVMYKNQYGKPITKSVCITIAYYYVTTHNKLCIIHHVKCSLYYGQVINNWGQCYLFLFLCMVLNLIEYTN